MEYLGYPRLFNMGLPSKSENIEQCPMRSSFEKKHVNVAPTTRTERCPMRDTMSANNRVERCPMRDSFSHNRVDRCPLRNHFEHPNTRVERCPLRNNFENPMNRYTGFNNNRMDRCPLRNSFENPMMNRMNVDKCPVLSNNFNALANIPFQPCSEAEFFTLKNPICRMENGSFAIRLCFDLRGFKHDEIEVTVNKAERVIEVVANHSVKDDNISRNFTRRFHFPTFMEKIDLAKVEFNSFFGPDNMFYVEGMIPTDMSAVCATFSSYPCTYSHWTNPEWRFMCNNHWNVNRENVDRFNSKPVASKVI